MFNLSLALRESAARIPEQAVALWDGGRMTYGELDEQSDRVAASLERLGLRRGDRVGLQLPNIAPFLVAYFGILKAGCVVVPLNVLLRAPEVAQQLGDCTARALITWGPVAAQGVPGAEKAGVEHVVVVGEPVPAPDPNSPADVVPFGLLLSGEHPGPQMATTSADDTAVVVYTSGTTGRPKGAELTHFQLYMQADIPGRLFELRDDDIILTALPLFHVFGLSSILNLGIRFGATLSLVPRFDASVVLSAIERDRCTIFEGVPTMFAALLAAPDLDARDVSSLRIAISGGQAIAAEVLDSFESRFKLVILEGYGLSETASTTTSNLSEHDRRIYSVGKAIWGTQTQIWDRHGNRMPPGREHIGEIVTRGPHTMKGYWNDPEATAAVFTDGWLHTGDLGYIDSDGYVFVVDRIKELIIRGGYNVYPREVEEVLYAHPAVAEAAVVGVPDARLGEEVLAFVSLRLGASATEAELVDFCRERLAAYKYPRAIEFRDELPKSGAGKILKLGLKAEVAVGR